MPHMQPKPIPNEPIVIDFDPNKVGIISVTLEQWQEYQRLKKAAEEIDQKTKQPDCIKPDLAEWETQMEAFLIKKGVLKVVDNGS
jgi:DNA-binding transcriptional regulator GbsR (MarR family)